jgi:hypothetical protein
MHVLCVWIFCLTVSRVPDFWPTRDIAKPYCQELQDHQVPWQPYYNADRFEHLASLAPRDRGTRSSYWDKFHKHIEAPKETRGNDPPTPDGDYSDNINYCGKLDLNASDTPQFAIGRNNDWHRHEDSALPFDFRNGQDPLNIRRRRGREKQKKNKLSFRSDTSGQLRHSSYDEGHGRPPAYASEHLDLARMPADWGNENRHWGTAQTQRSTQRSQSAISFDDHDFDQDRCADITHGRGRGRHGQIRRGCITDRLGNFA